MKHDRLGDSLLLTVTDVWTTCATGQHSIRSRLVPQLPRSKLLPVVNLSRFRTREKVGVSDTELCGWVCLEFTYNLVYIIRCNALSHLNKK